MTLRELQTEVARIFATKWTSRQGQVVPDTPNVSLLGNDSIRLDATVLYADLVDSTDLVDNYQDHFAAEVYKAYLHVACKIIREAGGEIVAFDGDRVMGVYVGNMKNSDAATSALRINWAVRNIVNPAIKKQYPNTSFEVQQVVGIDTSQLLVARTGVRNANDLVWVGRAANYAAKLCGLREPGYATFITEDVYKKLSQASKFAGGEPKRSMWDRTIWPEKGIPIYASHWMYSID